MWNLKWSNVQLMEKKHQSEHNLVSDIKRHITKFDTVLLHSNWSSLRRKHWSKIPTDRKVLSCGPKASNISEISDAISPRYIRKNPRSRYARVLQVMAQFVLKIEKLSHIMGTAPILEMARAYGLHPRLWLLVRLESASEVIWQDTNKWALAPTGTLIRCFFAARA